MRRIKFRIFLALCFIQIFLGPGLSWSHEGHDEGMPSAGTVIGESILLSEEAKENIALKVEEVEERSIDEVVKSIGMIKTDPNKTGHVSSRIQGRVLKILVNIGDEIGKDQELIHIESRQIGNPPPVTTLSSPLSGTIVHRDVTLGQTVEPDQHLFEIADLADLLVECEVYEEDIAKVKVGQPVRIKLPVAYPGELFEGKVFYISPELDPETRTVHLWIRVPNQERRLKPGMSAEVAIIVKQKVKAIALPREAVMEEGGEKFVYLDEIESFKRQNVILGISNDSYYEVKKGVIPGDQVVTQGNYELRMAALTAVKSNNSEEKNKAGKKAK